MWKCKHCGNGFSYVRATDKANHSRHCAENPNKEKSYDGIKKALRQTFDTKLGPIEKFTVACECCSVEFEVAEYAKQHPRKDKYFCSRSCACSIGGKAKALKHHSDEVAKYTTVAWRHHEKRCIICSEDKIVAVHHFDENHHNNDPRNLIPMCPTHHQYMHSRFKNEILDQVLNYIENKWGVSVVGGTLALQA